MPRCAAIRSKIYPVPLAGGRWHQRPRERHAELTRQVQARTARCAGAHGVSTVARSRLGAREPGSRRPSGVGAFDGLGAARRRFWGLTRSARGSGELATACRWVAASPNGRIGVPGGADGARGAGQCPGHVPRPGRRFWLSCCGVGRSAARARRRGDADAPLERWWSQMRARTGAPTGAAARLVAAAQLERVAGAGVDVGPSLRVRRARLAKRPHARDGDGRRGGWRW